MGHFLLAAIALASATPSVADGPACDLCLGDSPASGEQPLHIAVESGIKFSRLALRGKDDGEAQIDQAGENRVGPNMIDLGGLSYQGRARITGQPLRPVRIEMPPKVMLRSPDGAEAELTDFVTDLPPVAMLDQYGQLSFAFGARISSHGARGGNFRGRIAIRVDYY
ncbi:MAG: DUF4402 domain-containing protein [Croceibacterium sp.]